MHADELCLGGKQGPSDCPAADHVVCTACGQQWEANQATPCTRCGSEATEVSRCATCPLDDLEFVREHSAAGHLLSRLLDLEFAIGHFKVPWDQITIEEEKGLQILQQERERYRQELAEVARQQQQG